MLLSNIISNISTNCTSILQVKDAPGIARDTLDTSVIIFNLLTSVFSTRVYPLRLPKTAQTFPAAVYALQSSQKIPVGGVDILQQDVFVVYFQTESAGASGGFEQLVALRETVRDALLGYGSAGNAIEIEIADESLDYIDTLDRYQCAMQINITHLIGTVQTAPAVFIFEEGGSAGETDFDVCTIQNVQTTISFVIVCNLANIEATRTCLQTNLLGYQPVSGADEMNLVSDARINTVGNLVVWQQQYTTKHRIRAT